MSEQLAAASTMQRRPSRATGAARSDVASRRRTRARVRRRSAQQRRARGSAGTGKTSVLVQRYVNLLQGGRRPGEHPRDHVHPQGRGRDARAHRPRAARGRGAVGVRQGALGRRCAIGSADIAISTIDAFCLSLLREFPLEADLDPGFDMADETEVPRLVDESLDRVAADLRRALREATIRTSRWCSRSSAIVADARRAWPSLLDRRLVRLGRARSLPRARARAI